jgi:hypothetical protein
MAKRGLWRDDRQRVLAQIKNNLAKPQPSLGYELVSDEHDWPHVAWLGTVDIAADELVGAAAQAAELPELERAAALLKDALANGPKPVQELITELAKQRVSRRTLSRAKREAGVESILEKTANGCRAVWRLADAPAPQPDDPLLALVRASLRRLSGGMAKGGGTAKHGLAIPPLGNTSPYRPSLAFRARSIIHGIGRAGEM